MKKMKFLPFLIASCLCAGSMWATEMIEVEPITLTEQQDLDDLNTLRDIMTRISKAVTGCMNNGDEPLACQCKSYEDIQMFQEVYDQTLEKHPGWEGRILFQEAKNEDGYSVGISTSFIGLQKQYEMNEMLDCSSDVN
jgi:hypothetical protein